MGQALQVFNHNAEPFGFMIQCPKCLWYTNAPRFHAATCQFRDYTLSELEGEGPYCTTIGEAYCKSVAGRMRCSKCPLGRG